MAEISFSVDDIINAPTNVESSAIKAYWTSKKYLSVSEYYNEIPTTVYTTAPALLDKQFFRYYQESMDFGVSNIYTMFFKPTNPIPKEAWIQVIYPETVQVEDHQAFIENCEAVTSASFKGD